MAYSNAQRQAIQQNDPDAYLAAGGTLTNGKIPIEAMNAVNNPNYYATAANAYDFGYQKQISSESLTSQGIPKLPSLPSDPTNYQAAIARGQGMIAGGSDNGNQGLYDTANLVASLIPQPEGVERAFYDTYGKSAEQVRTEESDAQRELKARKSALRAAQAELQGTQAEIQAVVDTAKASVLQLQEESKGRGITRAGILPQEAGIHRTAAIAVLPLQSKALAQQARIASLQGDVTTAQETLALAQGVLDKAFEYKVRDIELRNDYEMKKFDSVKPFLLEAEKRRYEEARERTDNRYKETGDMTKEVQGWMKETFETDPTLAAEFGDLIPLIPKPESKTYDTEVAQFREKLNTLVTKIKAKTSYVQVDENGQTVQYQKDASGRIIASTREVLGGRSGGVAGALGLTPYQVVSTRNQIEDNLRQNPAVQAFGELVNFGVPTVIQRFNAGAVDSVSDTVLMRTLAKVTDPSTGVREEEYRTFEDAIGALGRLYTLPKKWVGRGRLTDEGRAQMVREIQDRFKSRMSDYNSQYQYYNNQASQYGLTIPPPYQVSVETKDNQKQNNQNVSNEDAYQLYLQQVSGTARSQKPTDSRSVQKKGEIASLFEGYKAPSFGLFDSIFK